VDGSVENVGTAGEKEKPPERGLLEVDRAHALPWLERPRVLTPTRARRLPFFGGVARGSDIMSKILRRVLERLRAAANASLRKGAPVRGGLSEPQS
jgi:hypothetical protein